MNIRVKNLGEISGDQDSKVKFILFEDGTLLFGKCQWHKDLATAAKVDETMKVVGAGVVSSNIEDTSDEAWGGWKSTGYGIVTPIEIRQTIRNALISTKWKGEILLESLSDTSLLDTFDIERIEEIKDNDGVWHIYHVLVREDQIASLASVIKDGPWFIHFQNTEEMIVVFKNAHFRFFRNNEKSIQDVKEYGRKMYIPEEELAF
jgi:hypothetical protein